MDSGFEGGEQFSEVVVVESPGFGVVTEVVDHGRGLLLEVALDDRGKWFAELVLTIIEPRVIDDAPQYADCRQVYILKRIDSLGPVAGGKEFHGTGLMK